MELFELYIKETLKEHIVAYNTASSYVVILSKRLIQTYEFKI